MPPDITKIDSLIDKCINDCYSRNFDWFNIVNEYDLKFTNITNNELVNFTISDGGMDMYDLNKKLTLARQRGFIFNQINKLTIKFYTTLNQNNIHRYLKFQRPILLRQIVKTISRNPESIQRFSNIFHNLEFVIM